MPKRPYSGVSIHMVADNALLAWDLETNLLISQVPSLRNANLPGPSSFMRSDQVSYDEKACVGPNLESGHIPLRMILGNCSRDFTCD